MSTSKPELFIGLMSGTSMDGIDAALVDFSKTQPKLIATLGLAWPDDIKQALLAAKDIPDEALDTLGDLDLATAETFAEACIQLLDKSPYRAKHITAIGSHGQTIRHRPDITQPFSLQIGNAERLASITGIDVISDFRTADIKAGGQGAPLAPAFHQAVFRSDDIDRTIVNIGGISNITVLPKDRTQPVTGFDCGPGNNLMDAWMSMHTGKAYDENGRLAATGKTDMGLLARLLLDEYFQLAPPKSTGFEYFNLQWLNKHEGIETDKESVIADMQSTLCELTATSIMRAINQYALGTSEIYVCGGGAHNQELMKRIQSLTESKVDSTGALGVDPDWVEAMAFAWLAYRHNKKLPGNLPVVTGASGDVVLGRLTPAS
jgi:anhydro-N-acetylmuramic acid kinase